MTTHSRSLSDRASAVCVYLPTLPAVFAVLSVWCAR